ncbi:MAG: tRNA pseudouridine(38-40) synthase TruA [Bacteroides sp.]|nr:tRNA pseudouridine(38-40) synthase TruA [Ruminococcus flavefaciens]MCM1555445.1 tRNA pseudouridine(38-40) synthase TruA [Bacteroides sp.]
MQRFFIHLAYNGEPYCGWQQQPNGRSVQSCLQDALSTLLRREIPVVGCGRTDTGVHAASYYAHFDWEADPLPFESRRDWVYKLNAMLDREIAVFSVFEVPESLHARFSAKKRTYRYRLHTHKDPFENRFSYQCRFAFDPELMCRAGQRLLECRDFTSFAKLHTDNKNNLCTLTRADFVQTGQYTWEFVFTANRFLRNMVRAMVGTMLGVGNGRYSLSDLDELILAKDRCRAGTSMPAHALFLDNITYF